MEQKKIDRINELSRLARQRELTEEERQKGKGNLAVTLREMIRERKRKPFLTTDYRGVTDVNEVTRRMETAWDFPAARAAGEHGRRGTGHA